MILIKHITEALGDLHSGRQTRRIVKATSTYIEKPRGAGTEAAFSAFCEGFARLADPGHASADSIFRLRPPYVLWEADGVHAEAEEKPFPTDAGGIRRYYFRAGVLLFFSYLFASSDMHCENLAASGDMPVLLDLETLLQGRTARSSAQYSLAQSVMGGHLICSFSADAGGVTDVSGLTGRGAGDRNLPRTGEGLVFLWERRGDFEEGFIRAYRTAMAHRDAVSALLELFAGCTFRQLLRPTETYVKIAEYLRGRPEDQRRDEAYSMLSRAYLRDRDPMRITHAAEVLQEEIRAVLCGEIPLFHTRGDGCDLLCDGRTVLRGYLEASPLAYAVQRLDALSERDLHRQRQILALAIDASTPCSAGTASPPMIGVGSPLPGEICADLTAQCEIDDYPGGFCSLEADGSGSPALVSSGFSLYGGLAGIMCMEAALYRRTENRKYLDRMMYHHEAFSRVMLSDTHPLYLTDRSVSLADGIAGMMASLLHMTELTEIPGFAREACGLAERLQLTASLCQTDYLNGCGALPAFLAKCGSGVRPDLTEAVANVLLGAEPMTTGAGHGAAGYFYVFSVMNARNFQKTLENRAHFMVQWEEENYCDAENNWYDLRRPEKRGFMSGWCSGAPGIGMTRHAAKPYLDDAQLRDACDRDIARAAAFLRMETPSRRDALCCGTASRLMAASRLGVRVDHLYRTLAEAERGGHLRPVHPADTRDRNPGLMQGYAGIAYALAMYGDPLSGGMLL